MKALLALLLGLVACVASAAAQVGFTEEGAARERRVEARALESIAPDVLADIARPLAAAPHVAGSPGQAAFRDTLVARLSGWGFDPEVATYRVWLPRVTDVRVSLAGPERIDFDLVERVSGVPAPEPAYPWANGYTGTGTIEAEVVYVNYGLHEDYERLSDAGVDVRGKIAVARYGRSYRGIKARLAEAHGAVALLLYSDPRDDGWFRGDPFPEGPWRPRGGVQRGSVKIGEGDPTTPDGPSVAGAVRVAPTDSPHEIPTIPVVPVAADVAAEILSRLGGSRLPDPEWQGALPFRYHLGPGPASVRVSVEDDRDGPEGGYKDLADVLAGVVGSEWPDQWVIVGAHIDAWGPGANDNVSGTTSVLAAARAVRELVEAGVGPRRSIVFAGWDGEEWGLIGSTEWVEEKADFLASHAVAYLNQDMIAGPQFGASATPSLKPLIREAAGAVPTADGTLSEAWAAADTAQAIGDLGGGSDFEAFYHHLGVPSAGHGFGGPYGLYHSAYDTPEAVAIVDPGFAHQTLSSELLAVLALRLANAEILPYDYRHFAAEIGDQWDALRGEVVAVGGDAVVAAERLDASIEALARAGGEFEAARERYLAGATDRTRSEAANEALRTVERELIRSEGLVGRPWSRNLVFATDDRNGYATLVLPSIAEALRAGDAARIARETDDLAARVRRAARRVAAATEALGP